jgi:1,4-dihydroxy-2-naphthoate octaprenyltransferase
MAVVFILAAALGLYLAWLGGWIVIILGAAAIISAIVYTGGPFPIGYHGMGDIFVFLFFGLAAVAGTFYIQAGFVSPAVWWMSIPPGLIITAILVVNNLRDLENDRKAGKRTLAVRLGEKGTKVQYTLCMVFAYLILIPVVWAGLIPWTSLLAWLSLPFALQATRVLLTQKGRPLNAALAKTGQAAFVFSLLFWVGLILS